MRVAERFPKKALELLHISRLATDCRLATGSELFDAIIESGERPDFTVGLSNGMRSGWELTQLALQERRLAQELFFQVTNRFGVLQRHEISHLAGYQIHMWFGTASDPAGLPYRHNDGEAYDRLVESLAAHQPNPEQFQVSGTEMPERMEPLPVRAVEDVQFISVPLLGAAPSSGLFATTGCNLSLAFQTDHYAPDEWEKLRRVVERKDHEGNNVLVISAGAPDRLGRCFLTEEAIAEFMLDNPPAELHANHLSAVILHFWSTGKAFDLLGAKPRELWPALFAGFVPASHPWVPYQSQEPSHDIS